MGCTLMTLKKLSIVGSALGLLAFGTWCGYRSLFPFGYSHCCDTCLRLALDAYAFDHGGQFPAGQPTPEASLSLLYPKYATADLLSGKTIAVKEAETILHSGALLGPESCGWHYVEGLTQSDDQDI